MWGNVYQQCAGYARCVHAVSWTGILSHQHLQSLYKAEESKSG